MYSKDRDPPSSHVATLHGARSRFFTPEVSQYRDESRETLYLLFGFGADRGGRVARRAAWGVKVMELATNTERAWSVLSYS
jgi:hypothetical protein